MPDGTMDVFVVMKGKKETIDYTEVPKSLRPSWDRSVTFFAYSTHLSTSTDAGTPSSLSLSQFYSGSCSTTRTHATDKVAVRMDPSGLATKAL